MSTLPFSLSDSIQLLRQTPATLNTWLRHLPELWLKQNEGPNTWSPYDVVGHLVIGEKTDWIPRAKIILGDQENKEFVPFDRWAQERESQGKSMEQLLDEFAALRQQNVDELERWSLTDADLDREGIHPALGAATLRQLIATWTVHDQGHIVQIARVMAKQYSAEVGPWEAYLTVLKM